MKKKMTGLFLSEPETERFGSDISDEERNREVYSQVPFRLFLLISLILATFVLASCSGKKENPLEIVKVARGSISASIPSVGEVMPRNRVEIKPVVTGRIEVINVNEGDRVRKGQILALISSSDRAALLDAARAKGPEEVKFWEDAYKPSPVTAPLDGFIIKRDTQPGQTIDTQTPVLVMADKLIVKAQVDETDIGKIGLGQKTIIVLDAYPDKKIPGAVEHIAYESQTVNNVTVYNVDVTPVSVPPYFRSGMSATVNFFQNAKENILVLPVNAVRKLKGSSVVFLKTKDPKGYDTTQVKTALENNENIEIESGLSEGQEVIIPTSKMVQDIQSGNHGGRPGQPRIFGGGRR